MSRRMILLLLIGMLLCSQAHALLFSFSGTKSFGGEVGDLAAQAVFTPAGQDLEVWLGNVGPDVWIPSQVLTAVFFDIRQGYQGPTNPGLTIDQLLTPESASLLSDLVLPSGENPAVARFVPYESGVPAPGYLDPNVADTDYQYNIGGEWAYRYFPGATSPAPGGTTQGISSSGLGLFGDGNFNGPDLAPPNALDGVQYGLLSIDDDPTTGNQKVTGAENNPQPLIWYHATYQLDLPVAWEDRWTIQNVWFQYGTSTSDPQIGPLYVEGVSAQAAVPEPASLCLLGLASGAIATMVKKRKKA